MGGPGGMRGEPRMALGSSRQVLRRLAAYALPHWRLAAGTLVVTLVATAAELAIPWVLKDVVDNGLTQGSIAVLIVLAALVVALTAVKGTAQFGRQFASEWLGQRVVYTMRNQLYRHVQSLSFGYHDRARTGELMSRTTSDVERVRRFVSMGAFQLVQIVLLLVGAAVMLLVIDWQLALLALATVPLMAVMAVRFAHRMRPMFQAVQEAWADLNATVQENLAGARVVRAFAQEGMQRARFEPVNKEVTDRNVEVMRLFAMRMPLFIAVLGLGQVAVLWYGGWKVIEGEATIGTLLAFNTFLLLLMMPVRMLGMTINGFARAVASGTRIFEVLDEHSEVQEAADAVALDEVRGELRFDGVSFEYEGQQVLADLSFRVNPGEALGIVGGTGSGKSTIINLLPRFYDPSSGRVLVDDVDVRQARLASLRGQIGIVHQEPFVFATSLRENIAYGRPGATDAQVEAAARAAQIHDFVAGLPQGYETSVGERGVTLSGGQKQRIAIARALLLDPRILVLDESTSSVDTWTERAIQEALAEAQRGRTTLIISQRIRSVRDAAEIIVLEQGRIVQRGAHEELIEQEGLYRDMWLTQEAEAEELRDAQAAPAGPTQGGAG
ncbi:MAG: ABC transporter ATP-binding protein [Chloroflexota bacterium]|nr:ABC transporter ATP-binding protein [Chloroflexota bacterium]